MNRVEFVFEPGDGYFWGAVEANRSQRFHAGESVTFCVGGGDEDDLEWPIRFPVTYTNPDLTKDITGRITIHAQADAEQCTSPARNRACRVLTNGNVSSVLGPGFFPFASEAADGDIRFWVCFYHSDSGEASLNLARFKESARQVRARAKEQIRQLGLRKRQRRRRRWNRHDRGGGRARRPRRDGDRQGDRLPDGRTTLAGAHPAARTRDRGPGLRGERRLSLRPARVLASASSPTCRRVAQSTMATNAIRIASITVATTAARLIGDPRARPRRARAPRSAGCRRSRRRCAPGPASRRRSGPP